MFLTLKSPWKQSPVSEVAASPRGSVLRASFCGKWPGCSAPCLPAGKRSLPRGSPGHPGLHHSLPISKTPLPSQPSQNFPGYPPESFPEWPLLCGSEHSGLLSFPSVRVPCPGTAGIAHSAGPGTGARAEPHGAGDKPQKGAQPAPNW